MNLPEKLTPLHHVLAIIVLGINLWNLFNFDIHAPEPLPTLLLVGGVLGGAHIIAFYVYPTLTLGFGRSNETRKRHLRLVQESGLRVATIRCKGKAGFLGNRQDYTVEVELYPDGLTAKLPFLPITAILAGEIERISEKRNLLGRTRYEITHHSHQVATPLTLRCAHDLAFCAALEALKPQAMRRIVYRR